MSSSSSSPPSSSAAAAGGGDASSHSSGHHHHHHHHPSHHHHPTSERRKGRWHPSSTSPEALAKIAAATSLSSPSPALGNVAPDTIAACIAMMETWADGKFDAGDLDPVEDGEAFLFHPSTLRRYAVARKGDPTQSISLLEGTLDWRRTALPPTATALEGPDSSSSSSSSRPVSFACPTCAKDPASHCFFPLGQDRDGNVAIYGNPPRANNPSVEETLRHVVHQLEICWYGHKPGEDAAASSSSSSSSSSSQPSPFSNPARCDGEQWTWIVDFRGFGFTHAMQARLGISFATVFANHMPERLCRLLLLNPPKVFQLLLTAIRPFADERTMSKVQVITGSKSDLLAALEKEVGLSAPAMEWMDRVLDLDPVPGSLPPLPMDGKRMLLPGIKLPEIGGPILADSEGKTDVGAKDAK